MQQPEALIEEQDGYATLIQRIITNVKKDSARVKTRDYYIERLRRLEETWASFEETDTKIREVEELRNCDYFEKDVYSTIKNIYEKYAQMFGKEIDRHAELEQTKKEAEAQNQQDEIAKVVLKSRNNHSDNHSSSADDEKTNSIIRRQQIMFEALNRMLTRITFERLEKSYATVKIETIKRMWAQIEEQHLRVAELNVEPSRYNYNEFIDYEERVQEALIRLSKQIETERTDVKLPKVTLPRFDGDYCKWMQFKDLFMQLVHKQPIPDCQKLWYLKSNVTGEAEKLIRSLLTSSQNYTAAWKTLEERYDNKRLLVAVLLNRMLALPNQGSEVSSHSAIKNLHDVIKECLTNIENLGVPTSQWDPIIVHITLRKVDRATHLLFEQSLESPRELPSLNKLLHFLETRFQTLETLGKKENIQNRFPKKALATTINACVHCKGPHPLFSCKNFIKASTSDRLKIVKVNKLCLNCLKPGHFVSACASRGCTKCSKKHNTLLHLSEYHPAAPKNEGKEKRSSIQEENEKVALTTSNKSAPRNYILLGTAMIILEANGKTVRCRAVLDTGSQINVITDKIAKKLRLPLASNCNQIQGIGGGQQRDCKHASLYLHLGDSLERMDAYVLPTIITPQPSQQIDIHSWHIPQDIVLADPNFNKPGQIDALLGAEFYHQLIRTSCIKLDDKLPMLQKTAFGWMVIGKIDDIRMDQPTCAISTEEDELNRIMSRFWQMEEVETTRSPLTAGEQRCETIFTETTTRDAAGRFIVKLPFSDSPKKLGESRDIAVRQFFALERRLQQNPNMQQLYVEFMEDYINQGYMEEVDHDVLNEEHFFLPHHGVMKPGSTTQLRVVLNASAKTASGLSLNDILYTGPTLQDEMWITLLRFRLPKYVFSSDIRQMYPQILLHPDHRRFQLIFWRAHPLQPLRIYQLNTVIFGSTSSPYLAIRCVQQLAKEREHKYPLGAKVLKLNCYVDNILAGADSLAEALEMQKQTTELLTEGGFKLHKWSSNHAKLLENIPIDKREKELNLFNSDDESIKILGLAWQPSKDNFTISVHDIPREKITRRTIASDLARLFDPFGLLGPLIVDAKIIVQQLVKLNLEWDAPVPQTIQSRWLDFREDIKTLMEFRIPRHVFADAAPSEIQFHIFADASETAYGAVMYIRSRDKTGRIIVRLLCAKSRVAPIKTQTIPRLELSAAVLATDLAHKVKSDLEHSDARTVFWTDSQIVLAWINSQSSSYTTFVANRIASIQRKSLIEQWRHVPSAENPADVLSRGTSPTALRSNIMWSYGPLFLHGSEAQWPQTTLSKDESGIERKRSSLAIIGTTKQCGILESINHKNSFRKLQRIMAYVLKFRHLKDGPPTKSAAQMDHALRVIVRNMQHNHLTEDIRELRRHKSVPSHSAFHNMTPFLDEEDVLRVGGRLENSSLPFDAKHPMALPGDHPLTKLLIMDLHRENYHIGQLALMAKIRQRFWPAKCKSLVRGIIHRCITCTRAKPTLFKQIMGDQPANRVEPARPFVNTGVDFCGPMRVHYEGRGRHPTKAYVAIFICFATKAVHIELASSLTTKTFIGILKRFMARRGQCKTIHCDNATNFVGANNELRELAETIYADEAATTIQQTCSQRGVQFKFIPPRAPHFGGLWEAAVKSAKGLLRKTVGTASLTYEQLETVLIEIEAVLNSRPLVPMSSNPNDLSVLTPAHFLIGEALTANIDTQSSPKTMQLSQRWYEISRIKNEFWRRWTSEYLQQLQHKTRWKTESQNAHPGQMVIIKDDNAPVLQWPLGRILQVHKGNDGRVRVVTLKTASGTLDRAIHYLAPLPVETVANPHTREPADNQGEAQPRKHPESTKTGEQPRKKARFSRSAALLSVLMTCLVLPIANGNPIYTEKFKNQPGVYFDNLGKVNLIAHQWKLIIYYDLQPYWDELQLLSRSIETLQSLCAISKANNSCTAIVSQFRHITDELNTDSSLLRAHRTKRGAMNIFGNIANSLFGVLDDEYAKDMTKTIKALKTNEEHLVTLFNNQTSVIDATIDIIRRDQTAVKAKFADLQLRLDLTKNSIKAQMDELSEIQFLSTEIILIISNIQQTQSTLTNILLDVHHQRISPKLLPPQRLKQELLTIRSHLSSSYRLPIEDDDISAVYKLLTARGRVDNHQMLFELKLPLITDDAFDLFKVVPFPTVANGTTGIIRTCTSMIAITPHRDHYYLMNDPELDTCAMTTDANYLCDQLHPIYRTHFELGRCEMNIFNNVPDHTDCQLTPSESLPFWKQLQNKNEWIFSLPKPSTLYATCSGKTIPVDIQGPGLLRMDPGCILKHDSITIYGHYQRTTIDRISYAKWGVNLTFQTSTTSSTQPSATYEIDDIRIQRLKKESSSRILAQLPTQVDIPTTHHFAISYIGLALGTLCSIALVWKKYQQRQHSRRTTARKEQTSAVDDPEPPQPADNRFSIVID